MKKWIKRNSKWLITGFGVLSIANAIYVLFITRSEAIFIFFSVDIALWLVIISLVTGTFAKIYNWWRKDYK